MTAFRRLEEDTRQLCMQGRQFEEGYGVDVGTKLFARAFNGPSSLLTWNGTSEAEHQGRANLFSGTVLAYRNPRAHTAHDWEDERDLLQEFLLVNLLFGLLRTARPRGKNFPR